MTTNNLSIRQANTRATAETAIYPHIRQGMFAAPRRPASHAAGRKRGKMTKIVTLCGSVRFEQEFRVANSELTNRGIIVLAPGFFNHSILHEDQHNTELTRKGLDRLHRDKIAMSDAILVIDVLGYVGKSTRAEIDYAHKRGRKVYYWSNGGLWNIK